MEPIIAPHQLQDTADSSRYRELLLALEKSFDMRAVRLECQYIDGRFSVVATASSVVAEEVLAREVAKFFFEAMGKTIALTGVEPVAAADSEPEAST